MDQTNFLSPESNPRQRILVVDDDPSIRQLNREILIQHGFDVSIAADGADAWDELQLNHYDLLVTDNDMPRLSGMGLIRRLHDAHMTLPIIMVTGASVHEALARQPELQIEAMLLKPYTMNELSDTVKNVLRATGSGRPEMTPPHRQHPFNDAGLRF
jgi:DNA-binding response OmpR family regulator